MDAAEIQIRAKVRLVLQSGLSFSTLSTGERIAVDADRATSLPGVYAGGDCVAGLDLTVSAVEDGKRAAAAIHRSLSAGAGAGVGATRAGT